MTDDQRTRVKIGSPPPVKIIHRRPANGGLYRAHTLVSTGLASLDARDSARVPADAAAAEEGVRVAYRAAGLSLPKIIWCRSPVEVAQQWSRVAGDERLGINLKAICFEQPSMASMDRVMSSAFGQAWRRRIRNQLTDAAIAATALETVGDKKPPLLSWICRGRRQWLRRRPEFASVGCAPDELSAAGLLACRQEAVEGETCDALHAMRLIAENAGWLVPYERFCWLSERPDLVNTDSHGRLHSASGPALHYRDGWSRYFWKGVAVPAWTIARPQDITLGWIDGQVDAPTRHAMIDVYTAERFIAEGGADPVQTDASATLWHRTWTHRGAVIDTWSAVEYASGARHSQPAFHPVPAGMGSPAEALSWLFGPQTALRHDACDG